MEKKLHHIAICGNIGCGKTTLASMAAKHYGWQAMLESVDENPYLRDFYGDMNRWAFHTQIHFLNSRFKQITEIKNSNAVVVQDRTIYEDASIFAANLYHSGNMDDRDYRCYCDVFNSLIKYVNPPDLVIYLRADVTKLIQQIRKRDRDYEQSISRSYLENLNSRYENWISSYDLGQLVIIDVTNTDFVANSQDFSFVLDRIDKTLK